MMDHGEGTSDWYTIRLGVKIISNMDFLTKFWESR
jgi:hypothetical protein